MKAGFAVACVIHASPNKNPAPPARTLAMDKATVSREVSCCDSRELPRMSALNLGFIAFLLAVAATSQG